MRILVCGGAGFIGSHLVERLLAHEHTVVVADNFLTGRYINLAHLEDDPKLRIVHQDLTKPIQDVAFLDSFDQIYGLASPASPRGYGKYPIETHLVNSIGTWQVLDLAKRDHASFVLSSTSEVYGDPLIHPQVESYWGNVNPNGPRSCYDEGKRFAESLTMEFFRQFSVDIRIARIFNTYGPRSNPIDGRIIPNFCVQALRGKDITVYGDGNQTRSFCYVDDLVDGLISLMETDCLSGQVINLGNPEEFTVREIAEKIISLTNSCSQIRHDPLPIDDPKRRRPDITRANHLLDWSPKIGLTDGLVPTIQYFSSSLSVRP